MSRRLFPSAVLLLLLVALICCGSCGADATEEGNLPASHEMEVFVSRKTAVTLRKTSGGAGNTSKVIDSFSVPALVGVGDLLVAFAEAQHTGYTDTDIDIAAAYGVPWRDPWATQLAVETPKADDYASLALSPTAVAKDGKIYLLLNTERVAKNGRELAEAGDTWDIQLAVGTVAAAVGQAGEGEQVAWQEPASLKSAFAAVKQQQQWTQLLGAGGAGIVVGGDTLVLPVLARDAAGNFLSTTIRSTDGQSWAVAGGTTAAGCTYPAVVEWEEGKVLMNTACEDGVRRVYESGDMGATWTEALGTLSRVWGNSPKRTGDGTQGGFAAATIDGKKVMLAAHPVGSAAGGRPGPDRLHLWLTDGSRVHDVGQICDANAKTVASVLLFARDRLFLLHEGYRGRRHVLFLTELAQQLRQIKSVLSTWKEVDKSVATSCGSVPRGGAGPGTACVAPMPTKGLVGFLSGKLTEGRWKDEYLGVDATVAGTVETTANGLKFSGRGAWAEWPVGKQGQVQRYHFANYNFTLVATVTIHAVPAGGSGPRPLLGVSLGGGTAALSVACDERRSWVLAQRGGARQTSTGTWETGKAYQVALVVQEGRGSVYVDAALQATSQETWKAADSEAVSHFFIGGDGGGAESAGATVGDVLLYNRPLSTEELRLHFLRPEPAAPPAPPSAAAESPGSTTEAAAGTNSAANAPSEAPPKAKPGDKNADGCGSAGRVLPPLFLLGLWAFAAL
ncbi:trans-sialidase [Trypanosoma conorhini]|uniref:Trans-sialidase n=1 Tax=Trypanosoma conorhini TaxID=83891 RepID=A0A422NGL8_9TRYP|nr:trans-sialidase [Trypanosoma conorhini]RNF04598.1 trans-sialidase [Trypanosoma conorhini]